MSNISIINNSNITFSKIVLWHSSSVYLGVDPEVQGQRVIEAKNFTTGNRLFGTANLEHFTLDYWAMALMIKDYDGAYIMTGSQTSELPPFPWKEFEISMDSSMDFRFDNNPASGSPIWIDYDGRANRYESGSDYRKESFDKFSRFWGEYNAGVGEYQDIKLSDYVNNYDYIEVDE